LLVPEADRVGDVVHEGVEQVAFACEGLFGPPSLGGFLFHFRDSRPEAVNFVEKLRFGLVGIAQNAYLAQPIRAPVSGIVVSARGSA